MRVRVRLFAALHELAGVRETELDVPESATAQQAFVALQACCPALGKYHSRVVFAINAAYADPSARLSPGDELALIPPVSGGSRCS